MKSFTLAMLLLLVPVVWLLYRPKFSAIKARFVLALKVAAVVYAGMIAVKFATSPVDADEMQLLGLALLLCAGVWLIAWLVTRSMARSR